MQNRGRSPVGEPPAFLPLELPHRFEFPKNEPPQNAVKSLLRLAAFMGSIIPAIALAQTDSPRPDIGLILMEDMSPTLPALW